MSLVNEALKKARMEAAREDTANRTVPYPALGHGASASNGLWIAGLGALVLLAGLGGFFLFRAGKQSAQQAEVGAGTRSAAVEAAVEPSPPATSTTPSGAAVATPAPSKASGPENPAGTAGPDRGMPGDASAAAAAPEPTRPPATQDAGVPRSAAADSPSPARSALSEPERNRSPEPGTRAATPPIPKSPQREAALENPADPAIGDASPASGPDRTSPAPARAATEEYLRSADIAGVGPIELGGIAWSGDRPFALLNGRVVRPGDSVSGLMVEEIQPNTVRLSGKNGDFVFKLK